MSTDEDDRLLIVSDFVPTTNILEAVRSSIGAVVESNGYEFGADARDQLARNVSHIVGLMMLPEACRCEEHVEVALESRNLDAIEEHLTRGGYLSKSTSEWLARKLRETQLDRDALANYRKG